MGMASLPSESSSADTAVLTQNKGPLCRTHSLNYVPMHHLGQSQRAVHPGAHTQIFSQTPRIFCSRDFLSPVDVIVFS